MLVSRGRLGGRVRSHNACCVVCAVVRLMHYKYEFEYGSNSTAWWRREALGEYLPALNRGNPSLRQFAKHQGWNVADKLY